jgi:hypothetical protein
VRAAEPTIRATLDMAFALISFGIAAIAVVVAFLDTGIFSLVLTGGAAFLFESALMALIGGIMSLTSARLASGIAV